MSQPPDPRLRAGDGDRDAVAEQLREAHAEGRLTMEELDDRLGKTYAARTFADLAPLTADLPPRPFGGSVPRPAEVARPRARERPRTPGGPIGQLGRLRTSRQLVRLGDGGKHHGRHLADRHS